MPAPLNHGTINQTLTDVISALQGEAGSWVTPVLFDNGGAIYNVKAAGAQGDGATDDTVTIQKVVNTAAVNGGTVYFPPGTYKVTATININTGNGGVELLGTGLASRIQATAPFTGTTVFNFTKNNCAVRKLNFQPGTSATYSSNPACDQITFTGSNSNWVEDVTGYYWNGWLINSTFSGTTNPLGNIYSNIIGTQGKQGIHFQGQSVGSYSVGAELTNVFMNHMQAGDALFVDGAHDVQAINFNAVLDGGASAFSCVHIKGTSAGIYMVVADCGGIAGGAYTGTSYLIERDGSLNRPNNVQFLGGITSNQTTGMSVDCDDFTCDGHTFLQCQGDGCKITGAGTNLTFLNNRYQQCNLAAGTAYDVNCTNTTGVIIHDKDFFESTAVTAHMFAQLNMYVRNCYHASTMLAWANSTPHHSDNIFAGAAGTQWSSLPTTPAVPATTVTINNSQQADVVAVITAGAGSTCAVAINGTTVATLPASAVGAFSIFDGASVRLTYTSAPTWVWTFARQP